MKKIIKSLLVYSDKKLNIKLLDYARSILYQYKYIINVFIKKTSTIKFNKEHWETYAIKAINGGNQYGWGCPDDVNDTLGNYYFIKQHLQNSVIDKTVIDLGSLTGKWTQYMSNAKKIWCVDLNDAGFKYIEKNLDTSKISFYKTKGDELLGIPNDSIDFIFSMDTLVRAPKDAIEAYFLEFSRVLKDGGKAIIHLPCTIKSGSNDKYFTKLSVKFILDICGKNNFNTNINFSTIVHGVLVLIEKKPYNSMI